MGIMTAADEQLIALGADRLADYVRASLYLREHGDTYESYVMVDGEDGERAVARKMRRPNPEVAMKQAAFRDVMKVLSEVGMTPTARARLKAAPDRVPDELEDFLRKGRTA